MAFTPASLGLMASAGSAGRPYSLYVYHSNDTHASILVNYGSAGSTYFNTSDAPYLKAGDLLIIAGDMDGTPTIDLTLINAISSTHCSLVNLG